MIFIWIWYRMNLESFTFFCGIKKKICFPTCFRHKITPKTETLKRNVMRNSHPKVLILDLVQHGSLFFTQTCSETVCFASLSSTFLAVIWENSTLDKCCCSHHMPILLWNILCVLLPKMEKWSQVECRISLAIGILKVALNFRSTSNGFISPSSLVFLQRWEGKRLPLRGWGLELCHYEIDNAKNV